MTFIDSEGYRAYVRDSVRAAVAAGEGKTAGPFVTAVKPLLAADLLDKAAVAWAGLWAQLAPPRALDGTLLETGPPSVRNGDGSAGERLASDLLTAASAGDGAGWHAAMEAALAGDGNLAAQVFGSLAYSAFDVMTHEYHATEVEILHWVDWYHLLSLFAHNAASLTALPYAARLIAFASQRVVVSEPLPLTGPDGAEASLEALLMLCAAVPLRIDIHGPVVVRPGGPDEAPEPVDWRDQTEVAGLSDRQRGMCYALRVAVALQADGPDAVRAVVAAGHGDLFGARAAYGAAALIAPQRVAIV